MSPPDGPTPFDSEPLYELAAMYRLVHSEGIAEARESLLGDGTKRKVWDLADGEIPISDMARKLHISPQAISQHARQLAKAGLLRKLETGYCRRMLED